MKHVFRGALAGAVALSCLVTVSCGPAASTGPGAQEGEGSAKPSSGPKAPDFSLPSLDGKTVQLSEYIGKNVVLINFWSTTCDPCMVEMPHFVELYKRHKDKGFVVLAISLDGPESRAQVSSVVHDKEMIFPVLLDEETTVVARYNPKRELPYSVIIGRDGSIVHKRAGYNPGDEKSLTAEVEKALAP